jgi:hypothetical protein
MRRDSEKSPTKFDPRYQDKFGRLDGIRPIYTGRRTKYVTGMQQVDFVKSFNRNLWYWIESLAQNQPDPLLSIGSGNTFRRQTDCQGP